MKFRKKCRGMHSASVQVCFERKGKCRGAHCASASPPALFFLMTKTLKSDIICIGKITRRQISFELGRYNRGTRSWRG